MKHFMSIHITWWLEGWDSACKEQMDPIRSSLFKNGGGGEELKSPSYNKKCANWIENQGTNLYKMLNNC